MAGNNGDHSISSQLTETISFEVTIDIIRNSEFQGFVKNLERSQHVIIIMNETHGMVIINGKKTAVKTSRVQIEAGKGCILKEFSKNYRVGTSLQEFHLYDRNKVHDTQKRGLPKVRGGHYTNTSQRKSDVPEERDRKERYSTNMPEYEDAANQRQDDDGDDDGDDDDDNNSQCSNLDQSLSANCITNRFNMMNFNDRAEQSIEVSLCSDSEASLSK
ncbi:unnamed protein product, partial [Rotaria socialis]